MSGVPKTFAHNLVSIIGSHCIDFDATLVNLLNHAKKHLTECGVSYAQPEGPLTLEYVCTIINQANEKFGYEAIPTPDTIVFKKQ